MKFKKGILAGAALIALGIGGLAVAQVPPIAQVQSIGSTDLFQDVVGGFPTAQSTYASGALLGNYGATLAGNNPENALIGGDATTNLWQRATTGSSVTTTVTYGGPDRWAYWSGASTAMTVSRTSTAADLPSVGYQYGFKMARTSGQTGVVQTCMAQEVESVNSYAFAGQTAEIDFHATAGSNFSAASNNLTVYLISGTSTDEGMSKMAYGLNAGGGGGSGWTGQVNTGVTVAISTTNQRYTVAIPVPSTATEIGVAICFTPVGTAGTNDYVALSGIQLTRNSALTTVAGSAGAALAANDTRAKAFSRRTQALETVLQQRYYYAIAEVTGPSAIAMCNAVSVTQAVCQVPFPVIMRIVPTMTYANGFATATTTAGGTLGACNTLRTSTNITSNAASLSGVAVDCVATTVPAAGSAGVLYNNGGSGAVKASAEL